MTRFRISYGWAGRVVLSASWWSTRAEAVSVASGMSCPARVVEERS